MAIVLPYVFGNLSGAIPASYLDANFNALADASFGVEGGTIVAGSGGLSLGTPTEPFTTTPFQSYLEIGQNTPGSAVNNLLTRSIVVPLANGAGPNLNSDLIYSGLTIEALTPVGSGLGQYSAIVGTMDRYLPPEGAIQPSTGTAVATGWAFYGASNDHTGLPSSLSGSQPFFEADEYANSYDDSTGRAGFVFNFGASTPVSAGGLPAGVAWAFFTDTVDSDSIIYSAFYCAATVASAVFDSRYAAFGGTTVSSTVSAGATLVPVGGIRAFYAAGTTNNLPSPSNPIENVLIGTRYYSVTGMTQTGAGYQGGTITISPAIIGSDGTAGNVISRVPIGLWMGTGQFVAFDYQSNIRLGYSQTYGNLLLTSGLTTQNGITMLSGVLTAGSIYASTSLSAAAVSAISINATGEITGGGLMSNGGAAITAGLGVWGTGAPTSRPTLSGSASSITDANARAIIQSIGSIIGSMGLWVDGLS